jgi:probable HAF family extracellular repeat protein
MTDLGTLGGTVSGASAVNGSGQVVGYSRTAGDAESHAFSWTQKGGMIDLGGGYFSEAVAVNDGGHVVGYSGTAFSWTQQGGMGTLGGSYSNASAVNGSSQVVGESSTAGNAETHAVLWQSP